MPLQPLDIAAVKQNLVLPKAWQDLIAAGFDHEDIIDRAYAHLAWTERTYAGTPYSAVAQGNARAFVSALAKGFMQPFDAAPFMPLAGDPHAGMKHAFLAAISDLANEFGDRVSSVLWDSLAYLGSREAPEESRSILKEAAALPHHYAVVDTHLHALGKVYSLMLHVQSAVFTRTGRVLNHNCDCNCSLVNLLAVSGSVNAPLPRALHPEATQSLFTHLCAESELILNRRLPFEYTITKEAQELFGVEVP